MSVLMTLLILTLIMYFNLPEHKKTVTNHFIPMLC